MRCLGSSVLVRQLTVQTRHLERKRDRCLGKVCGASDDTAAKRRLRAVAKASVGEAVQAQVSGANQRSDHCNWLGRALFGSSCV